MTKIKNTKKGMAKKTLSMSLVVAMLATSNVPVWAAEFSDGSDVAVATESPVAETTTEFSDNVAETPVVDNTEDTASASIKVNEADISLDLTAAKSSIVWGTNVTDAITGTIAKSDGSTLSQWMFRWVDENGIVVQSSKDKGAGDSNGRVHNVAQMSLKATKEVAGKTLTLYVYDYDATGNQTLYDINTQIKVTVEKQDLADKYLDIKSVPSLTYNGFAQAADVTNAIVKESSANGASSITSADNYQLTSSSATNAGDTVTITASADQMPNSPYKGSISATLSIGRKVANLNTDIIATPEKGLKYQYTGDVIRIANDKVTVKESESTNNGADRKLGGADLSSTIINATTKSATVGNQTVNVDVDGSKLTNFGKTVNGSVVPLDNPTTLTSTDTVEIVKRDLSTNGTIISVNTTSGYIPVTANSATLATYLTFKGVEGEELKLAANSDYAVIVKDASGHDVNNFTDGSPYTVTIRAKNANCENEQTFTVVASSAALQGVASTKPYEVSYTGDAIEPTKKDLGKLTIKYYNDKGALVEGSLDTAAYEITGYTNNVNATTKYKSVSSKLQPQADAYVNIKITDGTYKGQVASVPFLIKPLEVKATYITVPEDVSINDTYTKASEYNVPVTVVAKDGTGKKVEKTLSADDFTVKYDFAYAPYENRLNNYIKATVTVTNKNYILNTTNAKTVTVVANRFTKIVARKLTDAMVTINPSTYTYTGGKIVPSYAVVDGAVVLYKQGEVAPNKAEYKEVSITDAVNVGTGKVTVEGINNFYSGKATGTFTITPANTSNVKVTIDDQDYTGRQVRPREFKATLNGNDVSKQFEVVSYGENVEAGKGTVVLKPVDGNKNFTGDNITAEFNIVKEKVKADLKVYDSKGFDVTSSFADGSSVFQFDGNEHKFAKEVLSNITKADGTKTTAKADDFEIKYVDNVAGKKVTKGGKTYNVGYVYAVAKEGTGFAGDGTKDIVTADGTIIKGVVAKAEFRIASVQFVSKNVSLKNATYAAGLPVKPEVLIQIGGSTLVEGVDYTLKLIDAKTGATVAPTDVTVGNIYGVSIEGLNGYTNSSVNTTDKSDAYAQTLIWGVDKKSLNDCNVTVKDGVVSVLNGYIPVASTEYTAKNNGDGTYTVTAVSTSKNYTGSKTVKADGKAEDERPAAPMISSVKVVGNQATAILSGDSEGAAGYDYVISTDRDCITNKDYASVNKNQVSTSTTFKYVQQGTYYAYCHAWKRDANGKKVFSDWSNAYPFVVSAITPDAPVITNVKVSGSTIKVTYKAAANATGYDVVLGTSSKKENGETRPYHYGDHKVLNLEEGTVTATFKKVPKGTWVVGMHAFNRTSEDGKKVFSPWSNLKKATVK